MQPWKCRSCPPVKLVLLQTTALSSWCMSRVYQCNHVHCLNTCTIVCRQKHNSPSGSGSFPCLCASFCTAIGTSSQATTSIPYLMKADWTSSNTGCIKSNCMHLCIMIITMIHWVRYIWIYAYTYVHAYYIIYMLGSVHILYYRSFSTSLSSPLCHVSSW